MLSKNQIKRINSLKTKKFRDLEKQFIAEGTKLVTDLLNSRFKVREIYATTDWITSSSPAPWTSGPEPCPVTAAEMERITALSTPSPVLAVIDIPPQPEDLHASTKDLTLVLDDIRDPGNLGTIIRIADWFGIPAVICSETTVDLYNPKVVQATMGSIARVAVAYADLPVFLAGVPGGTKVYGTFMTGENIYDKELSPAGLILIGNESKGISAKVASFVTDRLSIPSFNPSEDPAMHAESLNASIAAALVCSEFRRRKS
jgi:RNA methyltransferase, TrmH family